jgi:hypothetical protein
VEGSFFLLGKKQNGRERSGNVVLCWRKSRVLYIGMYYFIYSVGFARNEMEKIAWNRQKTLEIPAIL